jgi:hypothetical protein
MNRRLLLAIAIVLLFAVGVIIWFFVYSTPNGTGATGEPINPLSLKTYPKQFQFIFKNKGEAPVQTSETEVTLQKPQVLTEIWNKPATGQVFVEKSITKEEDATSTKGTTTLQIKRLVKATSTILMFVDRTTGYIYGYNRELGKTYQISNTTIPGVYDAYIFDNGKRIILRYTDNNKNSIISMLANIPNVNENDQAEQLENISYLPSQVTSIAVNKKRTLVSYFVAGDTSASIYTISAKGFIPVTTTPFTSWSLSYSGDTLLATSKPSAYIEGQTVKIPSFESILGQRTGLMTNPSEKGIFLSSMWSSSGLKTFLSKEGNVQVLPIKTIASKCAWGLDTFLICAVPKTIPKTVEGLPDDWFQGRSLFEDSFVIIDTGTNESHPIFSFENRDKGIFDVTGISLSLKNTLVSFNKKQDATLWLLDTDLIGSDGQ